MIRHLKKYILSSSREDDRSATVNISKEDWQDYIAMVKEGVPLDVSPETLISIGSKVLLDETNYEGQSFLRSPHQELEKLRRECMVLDKMIEDEVMIGDEQERSLNEYLEDCATLQYYLEMMELFVARMKKMSRKEGAES
ncbi:MAG: hypothetical protein HPY73_03775 [Methanomassiliicoccales archaeon]|nr:MAG: hypothetical protein HPY73_03775 [Methanomassiliicoccales archaeon]